MRFIIFGLTTAFLVLPFVDHSLDTISIGKFFFLSLLFPELDLQ